MLDDLANLVEAKDVDAGPVLVCIGRPNLMAVENYEIAFRDRALEGDFLSGVLSRHSFEILNEGIFALSDVRIVLRVACTDIEFNCVSRFALVEHQVVKRHRIATVLFRC